MSTQKIISEIERQLQDDILSYAWLRQLLRDLVPDESPKARDDLFIKSVMSLLQDGKAIIGDAIAKDRKTVVVPWEGDLRAIKARMEAEVAASDSASFLL